MGVVVTQDVDDFMRAADKEAMREAIESNWLVTPEMHGAVGDGVANDRDAIFDALTEAEVSGKRFLGKQGATYRCETSITIDRASGSKPLIADFQGAKLLMIDSRLTIGSTETNMTVLTTTLDGDITRDDPSIKLASVAGIQKGDLVRITTGFTVTGVPLMHFYIVNQIDGNDVYVEGSVICDVTQAQRDAASPPITAVPPVVVFRLPGDLVIQNMEMLFDTPTATQTIGLNIFGAQNCQLYNCRFTGNIRNQCYIRYYGTVNVYGCTFRDHGYTDLNSGYENLSSSPSSLSFGYGLIAGRGYSLMMQNCVGMRGWHAFDGVEGAMLMTIANCHFLRNAFSVSTHTSTWRLVVKDCIFEGNHGIITGRVMYAEVEGCQFRGITNQAITYSTAQELFIRNNVFDCRANKGNTSGSFIFSSVAFASVGQVSANHPRVFECSNNTFLGPRRTHVGFATEDLNTVCIVQSNQFTQGAFIHTLRCSGYTMVRDNTFEVVERFCMDVYMGSFGPTVQIINNVRTKPPTSFSNSAMVRLRNGNTIPATVRMIGNVCNSQALVYFEDDDTTVAMLANNINGPGGTRRLATGNTTNTITLAINNLYDNEIVNASGPVITNDINNVDAP